MEVTLNDTTNATATVGSVAEDTLRNIENLIGGSAADTLTGDGQANVLQGGGGNDVLDGAGGLDIADFSEKTTSVVLTLNGATNANATVGGVTEDMVRNIENVTGVSGNDTLTGDALANLLSGGNGDDTLQGNAGNDTLDGGAGIDTASCAEKTTAVVVTLNGATNATATVGGVAEDTLRNVENVTGGSGNDIVTGDTLANVLSGGAGADTLSGGGGLDTLSGGLGLDIFLFTSASLGTAATRTVTIPDFERALGEVLNLTAIDANTVLAGTKPLTFIGTAAFSNSTGQLRFTDLGSITRIQGDVNGDGGADLTIELGGGIGGITVDWFKLT